MGSADGDGRELYEDSGLCALMVVKETGDCE